MKGFRSFDVFQKVNQDIDTSTATGGIYSIIALIVGFILFLNEFNDYRTDDLVYQMRVQQLETETVKSNIDIHVLGSPCHLLALDLQDEVGNHTLDYMDTIKKIRVLKDGTELTRVLGEGVPQYRGSTQEVEESIDSIKNEEGCRLFGFINLKKVPGNFHISYHAKMDVLNRMSQADHETFNKMNLNYKINHIGFGQDSGVISNINKLMGNSFTLETLENFPYDGNIYVKQGKHDFDNYLKVLPAHYENNKKAFSADRFKFAMYSTSIPKNEGETPAIFFRYEISPINVFYKTKTKYFYHFVVQIFAIIGGIFAVMGIFNSLTTGVLSSIKNKN